MKDPYFLGIGAQKSGTTTLHELLKSEREIYLCEKKEVQYFSLNFDKGTRWYKSQFEQKKKNQKSGEITPMYLYHKECARRIYDHNKDVLLIILLREPINRAISHYYHAVKRGYEELPMKKALECEAKRLINGGVYSYQKHSYLSRSRYIEQLDRYHSYFKKEQILIIKSEDMFNETAKEYTKIRKFLGLKEDFKINKKKTNSGNYEQNEIDDSARDWLHHKLKKTKDELRIRYGIDWDIKK